MTKKLILHLALNPKLNRHPHGMKIMKCLLSSMLPCLSLMATSGTVQAGDGKAALVATYWSSFVDHWQNFFQRQDGISMAVVGVGVAALFIITRGKWQK